MILKKNCETDCFSIKQSVRKPNMPSFFPCRFCLPFWMCFLPQPNPDILAIEVLQWLLRESSGTHAFLLIPASVTDLIGTVTTPPLWVAVAFLQSPSCPPDSFFLKHVCSHVIPLLLSPGVSHPYKKKFLLPYSWPTFLSYQTVSLCQ